MHTAKSPALDDIIVIRNISEFFVESRFFHTAFQHRAGVSQFSRPFFGSKHRLASQTSSAVFGQYHYPADHHRTIADIVKTTGRHGKIIVKDNYIVSLFGLAWWAIFLAPFAGAFIGELLYLKKHGQKTEGNMKAVWKAAFGAFLGMMCGIMMKLIYSCFVFFVVVKEFIMGVFG